MKLNDIKIIIDFPIFLVRVSLRCKFKIVNIKFLPQIEVIKVCNDKTYIFDQAGHFEYE